MLLHEVFAFPSTQEFMVVNVIADICIIYDYIIVFE